MLTVDLITDAQIAAHAVASARGTQPARHKDAEEIAADMLRSDIPPAVEYVRKLTLLKATLEACQLLASDLGGVSEAMGWGVCGISELPDMLGDAMHDASLDAEIARVTEALDIKEGD